MSTSDDERDVGRGYTAPVSGTEEADRALQERVGTSWLGLVRAVEQLRQEGITVTKVTIRGTWTGEVDLLVIVCADTEDGPVVAFHGAEQVTNVWGRLLRRIEGGHLRWKEDSFG